MGVSLRFAAVLMAVTVVGFAGTATPVLAQAVEYRVLATNKTSTMEKELNDAAELGYEFGGVMGGETAFGGKEVVAIVSKAAGAAPGRFRYRLLATNKTSSMQKELQDAGDAGYEYKGQTVFETLFGGKEVVVILERDKDRPRREYEYKLLATSKTSTMQKELGETGQRGYEFVGMTVAETALGGHEVVVITRKALK
ncbi:MAG: hypothetical protein U0Q12_24245 [Vicinamibacterales bacterium]